MRERMAQLWQPHPDALLASVTVMVGSAEFSDAVQQALTPQHALSELLASEVVSEAAGLVARTIAEYMPSATQCVVVISISVMEVAAYIPAQVVGAIGGAVLADAMFAEPLVKFSTHDGLQRAICSRWASFSAAITSFSSAVASNISGRWPTLSRSRRNCPMRGFR